MAHPAWETTIPKPANATWERMICVHCKRCCKVLCNIFVRWFHTLSRLTKANDSRHPLESCIKNVFRPQLITSINQNQHSNFFKTPQPNLQPKIFCWASGSPPLELSPRTPQAAVSLLLPSVKHEPRKNNTICGIECLLIRPQKPIRREYKWPLKDRPWLEEIWTSKYSGIISPPYLERHGDLVRRLIAPHEAYNDPNYPLSD